MLLRLGDVLAAVEQGGEFRVVLLPRQLRVGDEAGSPRQPDDPAAAPR
jgi:hypothetical protein